MPGCLTVAQSNPIRDRLVQRKSRTGYSVVKSQNPHPTSLEDVVEGGIVGRIRRNWVAAICRHPITAWDIHKMREQGLYSRIARKSQVGYPKRSAHEPARASGINQESGGNVNVLSESIP